MDAKLTLAFVSELTVEADGSVKLTLPTVLNPRYNPSIEGKNTSLHQYIDNPEQNVSNLEINYIHPIVHGILPW
jgi:hypothetical protein